MLAYRSDYTIKYPEMSDQIISAVAVPVVEAEQAAANIIVHPEAETQQQQQPLYKSDVPNTDKIYGAIIMCAKTSRYLLVLGREAKKWSFPKGHSKENETEYECLVREMIEETGFGNLPDPLKKTKLRVGTYFKIRVDEEFEIKPRDKKEIVTGRWVTVEETKGMRLNIDTNTYFRGLLAKGPLNPQPAILVSKADELVQENITDEQEEKIISL